MLVILFPDLRPSLSTEGVTVGELGIFLLVAYALGHGVAAGGNLLEGLWWWFFGGMPSNWVVTKRRHSLLTDQQLDRLRDQLRTALNLEVADVRTLAVKDWKPIFHQIYRFVLANSAGRVETFNGNYGLNRGIATALLLLAVATLFSTVPIGFAAGFFVASWIYVYRMYRFGVHFAREVLMCFLNFRGERAAK